MLLTVLYLYIIFGIAYFCVITKIDYVNKKNNNEKFGYEDVYFNSKETIFWPIVVCLIIVESIIEKINKFKD